MAIEIQLKRKYRINPANRVKNITKTKTGNGKNTSKAAKRMPRLPAPLSADGCRGWKKHYEVPRVPKLP